MIKLTYIINDEIIERIHEEGNIVNIVSEYLNLKRSGANYVGLCPFHTEKTPSFTVSESKQFFHCFGCGEGGDIISFVMKMENMNFLEASKYLADKLGIPLMEKSPREKQLDLEKEKVYEINREAARFYYTNLMSHKNALQYLQDRGLKRKTIVQFGLGFAKDSWNGVYKYLQGKGYKEEDMEKAGLIARRRDGSGYYDRFRNRIIFPIIDVRGRVIGFGGRVLDDTMPKYLNSKDTIAFVKGDNLYGLNLIRKHSNRERIILVEGYMDVIALFNSGIKYAVASLGTAFTENQARLLKRYGKEVLICYDSDQAGIKATAKAIEILRKEKVEPKIILLPKNQDPDDFIKEKGIKEFEKLIKSPLNYIDYYIYIYKKDFNLSTLDGKVRFTQKIAKIISEIDSPIEKDAYIDKVAEDTGISKTAIENEVLGKKRATDVKNSKDKYINKSFSYNKDKIEPVDMVLESGYLKAEKLLIKLMIENKSYFDIIKKHLSKEDFINKECKYLGEIIFNEYNTNPKLNSIDQERIMDNIKEKECDLSMVNEILREDIEGLTDNIDKSIEDLINTFNYSKLKMELDRVTKEIQKLGTNLNNDNIEEFRELSLKQIELKNQLESYI